MKTFIAFLLLSSIAFADTQSDLQQSINKGEVYNLPPGVTFLEDPDGDGVCLYFDTGEYKQLRIKGQGFSSTFKTVTNCESKDKDLAPPLKQ